MKKQFLSLAAMVIGLMTTYQSFAQVCSPQTTGCPPPNTLLAALCPQQLPDVTAGSAYDEVLTIYFPAQISIPLLGDVPIDQIVLADISGLPVGLTWVSNSANNTYNPTLADPATQYGCVRITGTPCGAKGTLTFTVTLIVNAFGQQIPFPATGTVDVNSAYNPLEIDATTGFLCSGGVSTLTATTGYSSYEWTTTETTEFITVSATGDYEVTAMYDFGGGVECEETASLEIFDLGASINGNTANFTIQACPGQTVALRGFGGDNYVWTPAANLSDDDVATVVVVDLTTTQTYELEVSNNNCSSTIEVTIDIQTNCNPEATCAPNRSCQPADGYGLCGTFPAITADVAYDQSVSFKIPATLTANDLIEIALGFGGLLPPGLIQGEAIVDSVVVEDVTGLPSGISWAVDQAGPGGNDGRYYPSLFPDVTQYGCVRLFGEACDNAGDYEVNVILSVYVTLPPTIPFPLSNPNTLELPVTLTLSHANVLAVNASVANPVPFGSTVTLSAPAGFSDYLWIPGNATTSSIDVTVGGTYTLNATANGSDCPQTATYNVTFTTGIDDILASNINIFPNPNSGSFQLAFDLKKASDVSVTVLNMQGKEVHAAQFTGNAGSNNFSINVAGLSSGVYMVKTMVDGGAISKRITVY